ncbi:bifunctional lysylphosphatidylglycerol flippase/synthetase MprF [Mycolicibacterium goodii]|uniref:bifunctional lysylphosphatidylglycerol flippase/synthetase MprF n=1 Tax=Mycolicibacterium goodii TaxID=134601 RepID=UPI0009F9F32F
MRLSRLPLTSGAEWSVGKKPTTAPADIGGRPPVSSAGLATGTPLTRFAGAVAVFGAFVWLAVLMIRDHELTWDPRSRFVWSLSLLVAVAFIARGIFRARPVTVGHAAVAATLMLVGVGAHIGSQSVVGDVLVAGAGYALMRPARVHRQPEALPRIWALVSRTHGDPLAPFAMQRQKSYFGSADGTAALAYRTLLGFAVVSGDPIGDPHRFREVVAAFTDECHRHGRQVVVLGCSEDRLALWQEVAGRAASLRPISIGRDVVIDVAGFHMSGRRFRNLRQAVKRTHNAGIATAVVAEADLDPTLRAELVDVVRSAPRGSRTERGFSMILDGTLRREYPGLHIIYARDRHGTIQGFQQYAVAGGGSDISLDIPWRRRGAPNGIDERLTVDMIHWAKSAGAARVSLAFAPFTDIFEADAHTRERRWLRQLIHLGDPLIRLESLYRYLRKFNALGPHRYVLFPTRHLASVLLALLILEFAPRPRRFSD